MLTLKAKSGKEAGKGAGCCLYCWYQKLTRTGLMLIIPPHPHVLCRHTGCISQVHKSWQAYSTRLSWMCCMSSQSCPSTQPTAAEQGLCEPALVPLNSLASPPAPLQATPRLMLSLLSAWWCHSSLSTRQTDVNVLWQIKVAL